MRLAYCTGMRRCDCSTNTTSATTTMPTASTRRKTSKPLRLPDRPHRRGEGRRDRGEDQDRHAVADAALGDELGEPHDEAGAGGHRDDHEQLRPPHVVGEQLLALGDAGGAEQLTAAGDRHQRRRLQQCERDREVAGVLRQPRLARLTLLVEGLEVRDDDAQQLHDDRRGDVRHDAEREDRQLQQRAAREQVDQRQQPLGAGASAGGRTARWGSRRRAPGRARRADTGR